MNLGLIGNAARKVLEFGAKNSTKILTVCAVGGVVATAVSTGNAVIEARDMIAAHDMDEELKVESYERSAAGDYDHFVYYRERTFVEKAKLTWKVWVTPVFIGSSTIGCIIGANHIHSKHNLALAAAYSMSEEAAKEFRDKAAEMLGEKKVEKIDTEIAKDHIAANPVVDENIIHTQYGEQLMYDEWSGRYFRSGQNEVEKKALMLTKRMLTKREDVCVNDLYELLGIPMLHVGEEFGWIFDPDEEELEVTVRFYPAMSSQGEPCIGVRINPQLLHIYV